MSHLKRLLAATDLSATARRAAERAARLAKESGAALDLVHGANPGPLEKLRRLVANVPADLEQRMLDGAHKEVHELAAALRQEHDLAAGVHVTSGPVPTELAKQAASVSADLIILGARGTNFMRHLMLGSTAERMLTSAVRPMLVVKQVAHERYRSVLVPVDFSVCSLSALTIARAVAPNAVIGLLHAYDVPFESKMRFAGVDEDVIGHYRTAARQEALQKLEALRDEAGLPPHGARVTAVEGDPAPSILRQEQERDCDLIVMGKRGAGTIEELLLGSVTRQVLAQSQADVLVAV